MQLCKSNPFQSGNEAEGAHKAFNGREVVSKSGRLSLNEIGDSPEENRKEKQVTRAM